MPEPENQRTQPPRRPSLPLYFESESQKRDAKQAAAYYGTSVSKVARSAVTKMIIQYRKERRK